MIDYYAARAPEYDAVYRKPERQEDLRQIEHWLAQVLAGRSVLEIACGTGYWTQFLAPVTRRIVALDAAAETLRIARARVRAGHVSFVVGDAYAPALPDRDFDAAFAGFWLSHVPRQRIPAFLADLDAALSPGATVVLLDNRFVEGSSTPVCETDDDGNTWQERRLADGSTYRILKNFLSEPELRAATSGSANGFRYASWKHYWAVVYATRSEPRRGDTAA